MILPSFLRPKKLIKYLWFGFGLAGLAIVANQYFPNAVSSLKNSSLVKGVQTELVNNPQVSDFSSKPFTISDLKNLDPQVAGQVLGTVIQNEVSKTIENASQEIKEFPQKQVRKIKIGACEELLEEDICSVVQELDCQPTAN